MNINLDTLHTEILADLSSKGLVIFPCEMRPPDAQSPIYWDVDQHPDYRHFIEAAGAAGAKIVTVYHRKFRSEQIEDGLAQLEESDLDLRERRTVETQLRQLEIYEGLTCQIELSFIHAHREYVFDLHTDWFDDFGELIDRIDASFVVPEDDDSPLGGGYYSKN